MVDLTEYIAKRPKREPTHPGAILRHDVLPALGVNITQAAGQLGVTRQTLHRLLRAQTGVTPEMAVRLGRYCGNGAEFWLRLQATYDLWHAERKLGKDVDHIAPRHAPV